MKGTKLVLALVAWILLLSLFGRPTSAASLDTKAMEKLVKATEIDIKNATRLYAKR